MKESYPSHMYTQFYCYNYIVIYYNMSKSKNKSQNKKNTKKEAPQLQKFFWILIHSDNTHATWTKSFEKLASIKKDFLKKFGNTVLGIVVDSNGISCAFTIEMLEKELKKVIVN